MLPVFSHPGEFESTKIRGPPLPALVRSDVITGVAVVASCWPGIPPG
jgi:hypothetical protein